MLPQLIQSTDKPNIFSPRVNIKPYEYPELVGYIDAIRHSYWIHTEYNYTPDIQDMRVNMKPHEVEAVNRAMMAISQIEHSVKTFWAKMYQYLPKPEIGKVGMTFGESEVRHEDAYSELLEQMGLNERFEQLAQIPALNDRIAYINKINARAALATDPKEYFETIIFFSMLIEYVSLFSQFYIIMAFNKHDNVLKGMSNAVEATSKEENIHAHFGFDLINIIKAENPEWWDDRLRTRIYIMAHKAMTAEKKVLDWIYEQGDLKAAPREVVEAFIAHRINRALEAIGMFPEFNVKEELKDQFQWFEDEVTVTKMNDFFQKRGTTYTSRNKAVTEEDLF